jgi:histidyl-tRNA synthetase
VKSARDYTPISWKRLGTIRERLEKFLDRRGYEVVSTPVLEQTELFLRKSGGELAARMYSFSDPSGRKVSLRPEFTSSVVRAYIDGTLKGPSPLRWQYCGAVFRYEGEQTDGVATSRTTDVTGSLEFQQLGAELIDAGGAEADAEVVAMAVQGLTALGVTGHRLRIGHMGVVNAMLDGLGLSERARVFILGSFGTLRESDGMDRVRSRATDLGLLGEERARNLSLLTRRMDTTDAEGMVEGFLAPGVGDANGQRTPAEILQRYLKKLREAGVPEIIEKSLKFSAELVGLSGPADKIRVKLAKLVEGYGIHPGVLAPLNELLDAIAQYNLKDVPVVLDLGMARGIAYYSGVVFEIDHPKVKDRPNLGGGGRYDGLVKALGGVKDVPALGYAYTLDRISELLPPEFGIEDMDGSARVLVTAQGGSMEEAVATAERLRVQGIPAELDLKNRTDADAAKYAEQRGIQTIMRVGQDGSVAEQST